MRIALLCGSAGDHKCGVGDYAYELAQHLALDAEVHLYHDRQHGPVEPPYERLTTLHLHPLHGFSLLTMGSLANQLRDGGYDVIHIQYPSKGYGASTGPAFLPQNLSGMGSGSLIVVTLHEWLTSHPLRKMVMDQMLPSADVLMVTSEKEMHALVAKTGGKQVSVLPVGNVLSSRRELEAVWLEAEGKAAPSLPEPSGYGERMPLSLFHYGLPAKGKGLLRLLEALKLVRESGYPAMLYLGGDFSPGQPLSEEVLGAITKLELADSVVRLGSIPRPELEAAAEKYLLGVFPFDEGFSGKRSSVASISHLGLPIAVGAGSVEDHPYYAPEQNTGASLSVLLLELLSGGLEEKWEDQLAKQREYAQRFSFGRIAAGHLEVYRQLSRVAV